jgi:hypothetical protein
MFRISYSLEKYKFLLEPTGWRPVKVVVPQKNKTQRQKAFGSHGLAILEEDQMFPSIHTVN